MWIYTGVTLYNCCFHNLKMLSLEIILLITWKRYWNLNTVFSRLTPEKKNLTVVPFVTNLSPCKGCQSSIYAHQKETHLLSVFKIRLSKQYLCTSERNTPVVCVQNKVLIEKSSYWNPYRRKTWKFVPYVTNHSPSQDI